MCLTGSRRYPRHRRACRGVRRYLQNSPSAQVESGNSRFVQGHPCFASTHSGILCKEIRGYTIHRSPSRESAKTVCPVKILWTLAQGDAYEEKLTKSIQDIKTLAKKIKEEASQCLQERLCSVDQTVLRMDHNVVKVDEKILSLLQVANNLPQALYRLFQSNPLVDRRTGQGTTFQGPIITSKPNHD